MKSKVEKTGFTIVELLTVMSVARSGEALREEGKAKRPVPRDC